MSEGRPITPLRTPLEATVRPPGSKSITNRVLVVAALARAGAVSRLIQPLEADDTDVMRRGLRALGVMIDDVDDPWLVLGTGGELTGDVVIDAGASGTTARFLTAVGSLAHGAVTIDGTERMRQRPISDLAEALTGLGVAVHTPTGCPPITVRGPVTHHTTRVSGARSSQFLTAVLLIAPLLGSEVELEVVDGLVSSSYVDGTLEVMRAFGADVSRDQTRFRIAPTGYEKAHFEIEPDASAAVYPAVAAAIAGGRVFVHGIPATSLQPDLAVLEVLRQMGATVKREDAGFWVESDGAPLQPVDVDLSLAPDGALAVAVACLFAPGRSRLSGLRTLRMKETDRLAALQTELARLGADVQVTDDTLTIVPGELHGADIATYDDHRMAMAFSVAGLKIDGVRILDPECVSKTWPGYFDVLEAMCQG
ncbi:MAG: 3-phosphoshikimate 1-carboxyvinyltransferase [Acidimicrobiia bacterium]